MSHPLRRHRPARPVAVVVGAVLVLTSCGRPHDDKPSAAPGDHPVTAPAATQRVESVTWNLPGEPASLDPTKVFSGTDLWVSSNVCESLLAFTPSGSLEPGLAASISTPDPSTYVVHLRQGVTFSDGHPLTAEDVVFSIKRVTDPASGSYWSQFAARLDKVAVTDDQTVTITLKQPDAVFTGMLATPMGQIVRKVAAEKAGTTFGSARGGIVCTGPYTVASWKKGDSITLAANDRWWGANRRPLLARTVKFTFIADDSTVASALANGDVDGTFAVPGGAALTKLTNTASGKLHLGPSTAQTALVPTRLTGTGPLANPLVREALSSSIDYSGIISTIFGPTAKPLRAIVPPGAFSYATATFQQAYDALPERRRDIAAARRLLAQAGTPHPAMTLAVPSSVADLVRVGEAIQSNAKEAGFTITIKSMPDADFYPLFSSADARAKVDAFITDWFADIPDPLELYEQIGTPGSAADFGGYDDKKVAALLDQARSTPDAEQRAQLIVQAQQAITRDNVWLPIAYSLGTMFLNNRLGGATSASPYSFYSPWLTTLGGR
ncbi:ABC transporter substrate-binding protein [Streptosporangium sp. NPDC051023]|uniref:ABC transporter substrate-binding protein n=1 Tax=Streptosporangium sp. NPDC051023 TaxID=3155410 RepID=UPI003450DF09